MNNQPRTFALTAVAVAAILALALMMGKTSAAPPTQQGGPSTPTPTPHLTDYQRHLTATPTPLVFIIPTPGPGTPTPIPYARAAVGPDADPNLPQPCYFNNSDYPSFVSPGSTYIITIRPNDSVDCVLQAGPNTKFEHAELSCKIGVSGCQTTKPTNWPRDHTICNSSTKMCVYLVSGSGTTQVRAEIPSDAVNGDAMPLHLVERPPATGSYLAIQNRWSYVGAPDPTPTNTPVPGEPPTNTPIPPTPTWTYTPTPIAVTVPLLTKAQRNHPVLDTEVDTAWNQASLPGGTSFVRYDLRVCTGTAAQCVANATVIKSAAIASITTTTHKFTALSSGANVVSLSLVYNQNGNTFRTSWTSLSVSDPPTATPTPTPTPTPTHTPTPLPHSPSLHHPDWEDTWQQSLASPNLLCRNHSAATNAVGYQYQLIPVSQWNSVTENHSDFPILSYGYSPPATGIRLVNSSYDVCFGRVPGATAYYPIIRSVNAQGYVSDWMSIPGDSGTVTTLNLWPTFTPTPTLTPDYYAHAHGAATADMV